MNFTSFTVSTHKVSHLNKIAFTYHVKGHMPRGASVVVQWELFPTRARATTAGKKALRVIEANYEAGILITEPLIRRAVAMGYESLRS